MDPNTPSTVVVTGASGGVGRAVARAYLLAAAVRGAASLAATALWSRRAKA